MITPETLPHPGIFSLEEQPNYGQSHVRSITEVEIGRLYIRHYQGFDVTNGKLEVLPPVQTELVFVDPGEIDPSQSTVEKQVLVRKTSSIQTQEIFLSALGLAPYSNGRWGTNWLEEPTLHPVEEEIGRLT